MTLGAYEPPVRVQGDRFAAQDNQNKPLIVVARQFIENAKTKHSPEGKPAVRLDVVDLLADTVYIDALWMSGALVDGLKPHVGAGTPLPVEIQQVTGASSGNPYLTLAPLTDQKRQLAEGWYAKNATRVDDERAKREAEAKPLGTMAAPDNGNGASAAQSTPAPAPVQESTPAPAEPKSDSMNEDAVAAALARLNG